jgi:tetratricopeptide (TPR) repeat protein
MSNEDPVLDQEQTVSEEPEAWGSRKESGVGAGTFLGSVILIAGLGGGLVYMQWNKLQRFEAAQVQIKEAIEVLENDGSFGAVKRARKAFNSALGEVEEDAIATSKLALLEAQSLLHDGDSEARARAQASLAVAAANEFQKGERFAAQALLDLADNKPDKVVKDLKVIFERGGNSGDLFFVFGLAQTMLGEAGAGAEQIRKAAEAAQNNVWFATASAEANYRADNLTGAMKALGPLNSGAAKKKRLRYLALQMYYGLQYGKDPKGTLPKFNGVEARLKKAEKDFKKVGGELSPVGNAVVANTYAEAAYRNGKMDAARKALKGVDKAIGKAKTPLVVASENAKAAYLRGRIALTEGDLATAEKQMMKALSKLDPMHAPRTAGAIDATINAGAFDLSDKLVKVYEDAKYRRDGKKVTGKNRNQMVADDYDRFIWKMRIALGRGAASKDKKVKARLADSILNKKTGLVEKALSSNTPGSARRTLNLMKANAMILKGDKDAAQKVYENWLGNEPKQMARPETQEALANLYIAHKSWKEAEAAIQKAGNLYGGKGYDVHTTRRIYRLYARFWSAKGDKRKAKVWANKAAGKG